MKFTLNWLKDHLDTQASLDEIVDTLSMIGLEVDAVKDRAAALAAFTVAYVKEARPHPNADRLTVCIVDTGKKGGPGRVRRAQCAHRHEGRFRGRRQLYPRHRHGPQIRRHPRRAIQRHAGLRARDGPVRRAQRHHRFARGRRGRHAIRAGTRPRRPGDRRGDHAEPGRLPGRARHRARSGRRRPGHAQTVRRETRARRLREPDIMVHRPAGGQGGRLVPMSPGAPSAT